MLPPLDMTKDDLLALLGSVNSIEAGTAISFVRSLPINDLRFAISFEGRENAAIGFWLEEKAKLGELFTGDQNILALNDFLPGSLIMKITYYEN